MQYLINFFSVAFNSRPFINNATRRDGSLASTSTDQYSIWASIIDYGNQLSNFLILYIQYSILFLSSQSTETTTTFSFERPHWTFYSQIRTWFVFKFHAEWVTRSVNPTTRAGTLALIFWRDWDLNFHVKKLILPISSSNFDNHHIEPISEIWTWPSQISKLKIFQIKKTWICNLFSIVFIMKTAIIT